MVFIQTHGRAQDDPDQRWRPRSYLDDAQADGLAGKLDMSGRDLPQDSPLLDEIDEGNIKRTDDACHQQQAYCKPFFLRA